MDVKDLLNRLQGVKRRGDGIYQCKCPNHSDRKPSLTITDKSDKILIYCHAGCSTSSILGRLGLKMSDLYKDEKLPETWQQDIENYKKKQIEEIYHYADKDGAYRYTKLRLTGKEMVFGTISADRRRFNLGLKGIKKTLYKLPAAIREMEKGFPIYFVEGEKDVNTMLELGLTATTCGGSADWRKEFAPLFTGATVVILPDNDDAGKNLATEMQRDLYHYAHSVKVVQTSGALKGDVTDYIKKEGHTKEDLLKLIADAEAIYAPWINKTQQGTLRVNEGILAESIAQTLNYYLVRDMNLENDDIYVYENGYYHKCNKNEFKGFIRKYLPAELVRSNLLSAVCNIILSTNRKTKTAMDFNADENIINVKNGLVDISQMKLLPHSPDVLTDYQLNCEYIPSAKCDRYLKFLEDLCTHDNDVEDLCATDKKVDYEQIAVLQEWTGLILSNIYGSRVKKALVLYSALGNTGKTLSTKPILDILGIGRTINVPIQKLSDRFSMGDVYGKRLIFVGDQGGSQINDSSIFKQITGGDRIKVERKGKTGFDYFFPGCMLMLCNDLPSFTDDKGGHLFERLEIVKLENVIPADKRDPFLYDKMKPELDGIFLWGLEGLNRLISNRFVFTQSQKNKEVLEEFRGMMDTLYAFISENCEITGDLKNDRIKKTVFEEDYTNWCFINELTAISKRNLPKRAAKMGIIEKKSGQRYYAGVRYTEKSKYYKGM